MASDIERRMLYEIALVIAVVAGVLGGVLWVLTPLSLGVIAVIVAAAWLVGVVATALLAS